MKINVKDLLPNPYRHMKRYPLDLEKVKRLKVSINETSFWDNILARPHPTKKGKYQIAYGHHRLIALRELKIVEVDIPVRELSDAIMVQIMANENLEWNTSPAVINQTVLTAKEFLDKELAKYETWEEANVNKSINVLFASNRQFQQCKQEGVGQTTILKFLGGNWKQWMIQEALDTVKQDKEGVIDRQAVEKIPTMEQAKKFKESVKRYNVPKEQQKKIATKIVKEGIGKRDIAATVRKHRTNKPAKSEIQKLEKAYETIDSEMGTLNNRVLGFVGKLNDMGVKELKGETHFLGLLRIRELVRTLEKLYTFGTQTQLPEKKQKQITGEVK